MKAFVVEKYGRDGPRAADVPEPTVGRRDVLVRVSAASINPLDKMTRNGEFKQLIKRKPPFVLGHDMAGVVTEAGADVRDFNVGDEVYARPRDLRIGTFAEYIAIDQDDVAPKPNSLTLEEAAAVPLVALAAWQILVDRAHLQPDQKVLVHAGAGGLGSTVIQLANAMSSSSCRPAAPSCVSSVPCMTPACCGRSSTGHSRSSRQPRRWLTSSRAAPKPARSSSRWNLFPMSGRPRTDDQEHLPTASLAQVRSRGCRLSAGWV